MRSKRFRDSDQYVLKVIVKTVGLTLSEMESCKKVPNREPVRSFTKVPNREAVRSFTKDSLWMP